MDCIAPKSANVLALNCVHHMLMPCRQHLDSACRSVLKDNVNLAAYFAWSFLDTFEWTEGYKARYGIVHVERASEGLQRHPKLSAQWLSKHFFRYAGHRRCLCCYQRTPFMKVRSPDTVYGIMYCRQDSQWRALTEHSTECSCCATAQAAARHVQSTGLSLRHPPAACAGMLTGLCVDSCCACRPSPDSIACLEIRSCRPSRAAANQPAKHKWLR